MAMIKAEDYVLGRRYNVEYIRQNGKCGTFSNILTNVDSKYFWFSSEEDGLDVIRQDRVSIMGCIDRNLKRQP